MVVHNLLEVIIGLHKIVDIEGNTLSMSLFHYTNNKLYVNAKDK
jgi:hypothetical protein